MDCSLPGSSTHGIFQARILEWIAISFSRGSSWSRDQTQVSCTAERLFTIWATRGTLEFRTRGCSNQAFSGWLGEECGTGWQHSINIGSVTESVRHSITDASLMHNSLKLKWDVINCINIYHKTLEDLRVDIPNSAWKRGMWRKVSQRK